MEFLRYGRQQVVNQAPGHHQLQTDDARHPHAVHRGADSSDRKLSFRDQSFCTQNDWVLLQWNFAQV